MFRPACRRGGFALSAPPANHNSATDKLLRIVLTAAHRLLTLAWFIRRPRTYGAHALALTPDGKIILVKLRYAPEWRPGWAGETAAPVALWAGVARKP